MLVLKNIYMKYQCSTDFILKNINLKFPKRGLVCIVGESGSGKSSLLNLIAGFMKPESGGIYYKDKDITKFKKDKLNKYHKDEISFIFQNYNLINYLNALDNIEIINKNNNVDNILEKLNILKLKKKKVNTLSGGEAQRVAIARALNNNTNILLCDEPTGALDSHNGDKLMNYLSDLSQNKLVILVTHNKEEAAKYANRIITLKDGEVIDDFINKKREEKELGEKPAKTKKTFKLFKLAIKNLLNKYKRNLLTIFAFSIGLITLLLVVGLSTGFNEAIQESEKNSLSLYPLYISKDSKDLESELSDVFKSSKENNKREIIVKKSKNKNKINKKLLKYIEKIKDFTNGIEYTYILDNHYIHTTTSNDYFYNQVSLLSGSKINNKNDVLLMINDNNEVSEEIKLELNLKNKNYKYEDIVGKSYKIGKIKYKIVGIVRPNEDSLYQDTSLLLYKEDNFKNKIPLEIYIYPKDYHNKEKIVKHLNKYPNLSYQDYSKTIKNVSKNIINGITIILLIFSLISLFITMIMISIITFISVVERTHEIGILKSLGFNNHDIKDLFKLENIIISCLSSLISIIVIKLISLPVNSYLTNLIGMENILLLNSKIIFNIIEISILISIIGSLIPLHKINKLSIIDAIRYE